MKINNHFPFLFIIPLFLLSSHYGYSQIEYKDRKNEIILINSSGQKCEVAKLIETISRYQPKVIGVNLLFNFSEDSLCNSKLFNALEKSNRVVLIEGIYDKLSDDIFYDKAFDSGETGLVRYDSRLTIESYYRQAKYHMRPSFPFCLAIQYDTAKELKLMLNTRRGEYPIVYHNRINDFKVLTNSDNDWQLVKDKIVLIGNLDSTSMNTSLTRFADNTSQFMNRTVIEANIILSILRDWDIPDSEVSKELKMYHELILKSKKKQK